MVDGTKFLFKLASHTKLPHNLMKDMLRLTQASPDFTAPLKHEIVLL